MVLSPPQGYVASSVIASEFWYDARDYGADPSGIADSTAAIQAMFNAIPSAGGEAFFPAGIYKISASINLQNRNNLNVTGVGSGLPPGGGPSPMQATEFKWYGAASGTMWDARGISHCHFRDFGCNPNSIAGVTCFLFDGNPTFNASQMCLFENLTIGGTLSGFSIGMKVGATANTQVSEFTWIACRFYSFTTYGIQINSQNSLDHWFFGCEFQGQSDVGTETGLEV